jgi:hypothetical protein
MGKISRRAADEIKRTVQIVRGLAPGAGGFAPVGPLFHLAKTTTTHEAETIEDVDIYVGTKGEEIASGQTVKAYNRRDSDVAEDEWIHIQWIGDGWEIIGGGGAVQVIGPCGTYTPDEADPDTAFDTAYPNGCEGPDVLGLNVLNVTNGTVQIVRLELESTGPLKLSSGSFNITCDSSTVACYCEVVFNDLDTGGVVGTIYKVSDDSVMQGYTNSLYAWNPMAGGNIQLGPNAAAQACECRTLPYDLCLSIPTR